MAAAPAITAESREGEADCGAPQPTILDRLLRRSVTKTEFFRQYWQRAPLLVPAEVPDSPSAPPPHPEGPHPLDVRELCSVFDLEELWTNILHRRDGKGPELSGDFPILIFREGHQESHISNPFFAFANGYSVVVNRADRYSSAIHRICHSLMKEDGFPFVFCNVYLTPVNAQTVSAHTDDREVFLLQISGEKEWVIYDHPPVSLPYKDEEVGKTCKVTDEMKRSVALRQLVKAGDLLYLPRGWLHEAKTGTEQHSLHLTIAVQTSDWDYSKLVTNHLRHVLRSPQCALSRACLPLPLLSRPDWYASDFEPSPALVQHATEAAEQQYREVAESLIAALRESLSPAREATFPDLLHGFHQHLQGVRAERDADASGIVPLRNPVKFRTQVMWNPQVSFIGADQVQPEGGERVPFLPLVLRFARNGEHMNMATAESVGRALMHVFQHHKDAPLQVGDIPFIGDPLAKLCLANLSLRNGSFLRVT